MTSDFELAMTRPDNYFKLPPQEQWDIDKRLGILDWDGNCSHRRDSVCKPCEKRWDAKWRKSSPRRKTK